MSGKIVPYIVIGLVQATIILAAAYAIFGVPFAGSIGALYVASLLFIAANLTVGITLSSLAQNQLQAMQLTFFYFLPGILLKGNGWVDLWPDIWPLLVFTAIVMTIALAFYRRTLD